MAHTITLIEHGLLTTMEGGTRTLDLGGNASTEEFTCTLCEDVGRA